MRVRGFTLIELIVVMSLMGLILTMAMPRLTAFLSIPTDRELREIGHFVLRAERRAVRESLVPENQPDARPLRIKIVPPKNMLLLRGDTELSKIELSVFRIEEIEQDGVPTIPEPEFDFNPIGIVSPFSMNLAGPAAKDHIRWSVDRLGGIRAEPLL